MFASDPRFRIHKKIYKSKIQKKASSFPRQCPWLEVQRFIVDVLLLHVENFGSKNCYSVPEIARTSRFADLVESR